VVEVHFRTADSDKDGAVSGPEAVAFFGKSGLPTPVLRQVWDMASGGGPKLNKGQFVNALRLVSLCQSMGGTLDLPKARVTLAGMGPALAPPDMTGAWRPGPKPAPPPAGFSPQTTGGSAGSAASSGGMGGMAGGRQGSGVMPGVGIPQGYPQGAGAFAARPTGPGAAAGAAGAAPSYAPQFTGAGYTPQATGVGGLPPAQPADMQRYEAAFLQLDKDRDGLVQGRDCFGYFMQWSLDKAVLKHIWDVVAGNKGTLNKQQLASCLYLMDNAKKGIKPPLKLPPGPFPPVATSWTPQTQFNQAKLGAAPPYQPPPLPTMPQLPAKYVEPAVTSPPPEKPSQAPKLDDSTAALLSESERAKITMTQREAAEREAKLNSAEAQAAAAKSKLAAYNKALQEITVFKSRTELALLQGQDEASRLEEELTECKRKYEQSYNHAQSQGRAANKLRERLAEIIEQRTEGEKKLMQLQSEIAEASKLTPQDVANMEAHLAVLAGQLAGAEQARNAYSLRLSTIREQRAALEAKLKELAEGAAAAAKEEDAARAEVLALANEAQAARNNKGGKGGVGKTAELLSKAAAAYRTLYSSVERAGGEVPFDARPANLGLATWMDDALAGAADFADAMGGADAAHGYVLVNALPGQVMPKPTPPPAKDEQGNVAALPADDKQQQQQQQPGSAPLPADSFTEGFGDDAFVMVNGDQEGGSGAPPAAAPEGADPKGAEEKKGKSKKGNGKGNRSKEEGAPAQEPTGQPADDLLGGDGASGGAQAQDQSDFQIPPPPSEAYVSSKGHRRDASSESRASAATLSTAPSGSTGLGGPLGGSGSGGGGGFGGFGWQPEDTSQQQSYPAKAGKKRGGGGLDGLFADGPPFPPPPPPVPAPTFPAFNLNPPVGAGDGTSSDEDEDGSEVHHHHHHHHGGADSSDDGMHDEAPGFAPPAPQPMFQGGHNDSSDDEMAEEQPPPPPPPAAGSPPRPAPPADAGGELSSSADVSHFHAGPSHSLEEESSPRAGPAHISSPISPGGPPAQLNPTYSEDVAGGASPKAAAVHNPMFSDSSDQGSEDSHGPEARAPPPASSSAAPPQPPQEQQQQPAAVPPPAAGELTPEPSGPATEPAAESPAPTGGQSGDENRGDGAGAGDSSKEQAAGGGAGADPSNDDSLL